MPIVRIVMCFVEDSELFLRKAPEALDDGVKRRAAEESEVVACCDSERADTSGATV